MMSLFYTILGGRFTPAPGPTLHETLAIYIINIAYTDSSCNTEKLRLIAIVDLSALYSYQRATLRKCTYNLNCYKLQAIV